MDRPGPHPRVEAALIRCGAAAVVAACVLGASTWVGWTADAEWLTRLYPSGPPMAPWTAWWLVALGAAIQAQSGHPSRGRMWAGRALAVAVGALAVAVLAEYATAGSFGVDEMWFGPAVRGQQASWPGRPSPQTASSVLLLAGAVALMRVDRRARVVWLVCLSVSGIIPIVILAAYLFDAVALVGVSPSTGQAHSTALALLLLVVATTVARPDQSPLAWLLARPDRGALVRLAAILGGFPLVVALSRTTFVALGLGEHVEWTLSIAVGTIIVGAVSFYSSQREQRLLIEKELVSKERADAETRYRILADNAVDIVVHLRGSRIAWVSPSVQAAFGGPAEQWIGREFARRIHPGDAESFDAALQRIAGGEAVVQRFRVRSGGGRYHWVEGHGKPYFDAEGRTDGVIAALRIVDAQVEAEQRLERLARFDTLTGLVNRAEAIGRLESALAQPSGGGTHLGILFCDIDHFKNINDTWGHGIGDAVLATLAARIRECVRPDDTVGRTGGDEILVLLPGIQSLDETAQIAEKIRCRAAEPIHESGTTIRATLSIGATIALPGEPVSSITARADSAMYQAKSGDRNTVIRI